MFQEVYYFLWWHVAARLINNTWRKMIETVVNRSYAICAEDLRGGSMETAKKIQTFNFIRKNCDRTRPILFSAGIIGGNLGIPCIAIKYIENKSHDQVQTSISWCSCCSCIGTETELSVNEPFCV